MKHDPRMPVHIEAHPTFYSQDPAHSGIQYIPGPYMYYAPVPGSFFDRSCVVSKFLSLIICLLVKMKVFIMLFDCPLIRWPAHDNPADHPSDPPNLQRPYRVPSWLFTARTGAFADPNETKSAKSESVVFELQIQTDGDHRVDGTAWYRIENQHSGQRLADGCRKAIVCPAQPRPRESTTQDPQKELLAAFSSNFEQSWGSWLRKIVSQEKEAKSCQ